MKNESSGKQNTALTGRRAYRVVAVLSTCLFVGLIAYMIWFQIVKRDEYLNSPYNARQQEAQAKIIRGNILSSDGEIIAGTEISLGDEGEGAESRVYPYGELFAHTAGYQSFGGSGLEAAENSTLNSSHADIVTQVKNDLYNEKKQGDNLVSTLDAHLQQAAASALGNRNGAVVVMEVSTGRVLADVSSPGFDPNNIADEWETLRSDDNGILMNRALQGLYPPGSTFKIVTALAYLRQFGSFDSFSYTCTGEYTWAGHTIHCNNNARHGAETFDDAMANSCNCAFAYMAAELMDRGNFRKTADSLGFNQKPDLKLPASASRFTLEASSPDALAMQTAIGQGNTLATPLQMCRVAQAVANDGVMMRPLFTESVVSASGAKIRTDNPKSEGSVMTSAEAAALRTLMEGVVSHGTASGLAKLPFPVAGKTGTAQYGSASSGAAHAWFCGFSETGADDIAVCILIEDGGNATKAAVPAAKKIFEAWYKG